MQWKARLSLTLLTVVGSLLLGLIGGWFGPVLSWWWLLIVTLLAFFLVVPWSPVTWSQEDILEDMQAFLKAHQELSEKIPKIEEMAADLEASAGMSLEEVQQLGAAFEEARALSPDSTRTLRELLFQYHRRMLVVMTLLLLFIGVGGALLSHQFVLWFLQR